MANHVISFLKNSISVIEKIGEKAFFEKFNDLGNELEISILHKLAENVSKEYNINAKELLCNKNKGNRNLTIPKNIFIYLGDKYDRNTLNSFGYNPVRIYQAKTFINGLIETLSDHKKILEQVSFFENSINKN